MCKKLYGNSPLRFRSDARLPANAALTPMILINGAYGYTGRLMVDECVRRGLRPVVAGPFVRTSATMVAACLASGAHYLDITGEIGVFEACKRHDADARQAGVVLLPGVGFDVVPTDCLSARLAEQLPDATLLELAFCGGGSFSRGTLKTMVLGQDQGGAIRKDGRIVRVPVGWKTQPISFRDKSRVGVTIPWGDMSTAHWSTGIQNIHTYIAYARVGTRDPGRPLPAITRHQAPSVRGSSSRSPSVM